MKIFELIKSFLTENNILFTTKEHEPTSTSEIAARVRGDALSSGAKANVYKIEKEFYLFVFAADRKMNTKKIKAYFKEKGNGQKVLDSRLRMS